MERFFRFVSCRPRRRRQRMRKQEEPSVTAQHKPSAPSLTLSRPAAAAPVSLSLSPVICFLPSFTSFLASFQQSHDGHSILSIVNDAEYRRLYSGQNVRSSGCFSHCLCLPWSPEGAATSAVAIHEAIGAAEWSLEHPSSMPYLMMTKVVALIVAGVYFGSRNNPDSFGHDSKSSSDRPGDVSTMCFYRESQDKHRRTFVCRPRTTMLAVPDELFEQFLCNMLLDKSGAH